MKAARQLLVATRSRHKLEEIRAILAGAIDRTCSLVDLEEAGVPPDPVEDSIEVFDTFRGNALAKARHFAGLTRLATIADDSGIAVDALHGAPGVRSRRFAGRDDLDGRALDDANNALLLERMRNVKGDARAAHYVCAAAFVDARGAAIVTLGTCAGRILERPAGRGGFGYDPLFYLPQFACSFGELDSASKNRVSHRGRAFRALAAVL